MARKFGSLREDNIAALLRVGDQFELFAKIPKTIDDTFATLLRYYDILAVGPDGQVDCLNKVKDLIWDCVVLNTDKKNRALFRPNQKQKPDGIWEPRDDRWWFSPLQSKDIRLAPEKTSKDDLELQFNKGSLKTGRGLPQNLRNRFESEADLEPLPEEDDDAESVDSVESLETIVFDTAQADVENFSEGDEYDGNAVEEASSSDPEEDNVTTQADVESVENPGFFNGVLNRLSPGRP